MSGAFNNDGRGISPLIATSWERCNKLMKRETWNVPHQAQGVTFASIYRRKKAMLTLGQAALEDAWEYMAPRECALLILDSGNRAATHINCKHFKLIGYCLLAPSVCSPKRSQLITNHVHFCSVHNSGHVEIPPLVLTQDK